MKILILGGSGVLSTDFTIKTVNEGNEVFLFNRGIRKNFIDGRANNIIGDIRKDSVEELRKKIFEASEEYDVVVDFLTFNKDQLSKTLEVIRDRFKQYIFISSATVYKKSDENEIITEETPLGNDKWDYAYQKFLCEKSLRDQDICYTIIRPYVTYGKTRIPFPIIPDRKHYTLLARIIEDKPVLLYENGEAICTLTHTTDFANMLYGLLLNERAYCEDFHITSPVQQTWKDVYGILCSLLGKKEHGLSVSGEQIRKFMPDFYEILKGDKGTNMRFDNTKVLSVLGGGYSANYITLADGLKQSVDFYCSNDYMKGIDFKWDGQCDYLIRKVCGERFNYLSGGVQQYSNSRKYYSIMTTQPLRLMYDTARKVKHLVM